MPVISRHYQLYDVFVQDQNLYLALEFMSSDLETVIEELAPLPLPHMKSYMKMALDGLCFMHENYLLHRV